MKRNRLDVPWSLLAGLLLLATLAEGLKGTALVISKLKQNQGLGGPVAESRSSEEEPGSSSTESSGDALALSASGGDATNATTKSPLTGIPQIDYVHDPNLPKELNGYNLTNYPFYERVPDDIDFKCDGLHDGFYASIPHKCQVYHHCLFGTRYDFLCANYTAFDQKTFICHFVSEVDCINSPKYFKRNEALYKEASTTVATTTTAATQPPPPARRPAGTRRRRPYRRRPADYYYEDEYADDAEYYDDEVPAHRSTTAAPLPAGNGRRRKRPRPRPVDDDRYYPASAPSAPLDHEDPQPEADLKPRPSMSVYERPRVPPKVRRPVPVNERDKYDYTTRKPGQIPATGPQETVQESYPRTKPQARPLAQADDYYDDEEEYVQPARGSQQGSSRAKNPDYYPPTATDDRDIVRRPTMTGAGRPLRRNRPAGAPRRRPAETSTAYAPLPLEDESEDYEEPYEEPRRPVRPVNGVRKRPQQGSVRQDEYQRPAVRQEPEYTQSRRPAYRGGQSTRYEDEEDTVDVPVPASRPAYISTAPGGSSSSRPVYRKRVQQQPEPVDDYLPSRSGVADTTPYRRPVAHRKEPAPARQPAYAEDEEVEYYDDEELPDETPQHNNRNRPKQPQRTSQAGAGSYREPVNPLPPPPPSKVNAQIEDDEVIPQRSGNGNRPFLPSRGGNPTLPRGLQTVGVKAPQASPRLGGSNVDQDLPVKVSQPLSTSSYRPKLEVDYVQPSQPRQSSLPKPNAPSIADALTSRPVAIPQSTYKSTGSKYSQIDSREDEQPSRVQSGNTEYRSKIVEDVQPRVPTSTSGTLRTKQTATSNVGDTSTRNANGKYRPSAPDTTVQRNPSSAPISGQSSSSGYRPKPDDISTAKTSPPLYNIREDSNTNRQQQPQSIKTLAVVTEDIRSAVPSAISKPQPSSVVYRSPAKTAAKPSTNPLPRLPDLPARTNLADIDESEYDVTLNDALHPTLHPTRSVATGIVSFPQQSNLQRVQVFKTKIGSPSSSSLSSSSSPRREAEVVSNDPSSSLTGGRGYLVGSASQRYITREPYTSLSVHSKDPGLAVVESDPRDGQLAYLHQQDDPVVYNAQHPRKRRPAPQYEDEQTSHVAVNPPRYTRADSQYQRGGVNRESLPLYLDDDTSYSNDRHRQSWSHQQRRRDSNADYVAQY